MEKVTIEMIETREFKSVPRGYDPQEVDNFLDEICDEMDRQLSEIDELKQRLSQVKVQATAQQPTQVMHAVSPAKNDASSQEVMEILEMARKLKADTIAEAERKAAEITADAENKAKTMLGDLEAKKAALQAEVASLKETVQSHREQFTALLKEQLDAVTKMGSIK